MSQATSAPQAQEHPLIWCSISIADWETKRTWTRRLTSVIVRTVLLGRDTPRPLIHATYSTGYLLVKHTHIGICWCQLCGQEGGKAGEKLNWALIFSLPSFPDYVQDKNSASPEAEGAEATFKLLCYQGLPRILTFMRSSRLVRWLLWSEKISESSSNISILSLWNKTKKQ